MPRLGHVCISLVFGVLPYLSAACADEPAAGRPPSAAEDAGPEKDVGNEAVGSYARVQAIFARSCAYERCHSGAIIGGALNLARGSDYAAALIGVPACEYERMARVEPGDPERSWLMVKLTAAVRPASDAYADYILFEPATNWDGTRRGCPDQTDDGTPLFGQRMPLTAPNMLPEEDLDAIRAWIAAGAQH